MGIEPTSLTRHDFKSCAYTSSAIRAYLIFLTTLAVIEAWGGIEPPYKDFADLCLTTWLLRRPYILVFYCDFVNSLAVLFPAVQVKVELRHPSRLHLLIHVLSKIMELSPGKF